MVTISSVLRHLHRCWVSIYLSDLVKVKNKNGVKSQPRLHLEL